MKARTSFVLWAQRQRWPVPAGLRRRLAKRLRGAGAGPSPVDDWSAPLIGDRAAPVQPPEPAHATDDAARGATTAPPTSLRTVIATSVLEPGGLAEVVAFLARCLPQHGVATTIVHAATPAPAVASPVQRALEADGIEVTHCAERDVDAYLAAHRPDVVSAHDPPDWFVHAAARAGIPVVETLHGLPTPLGTDWRREPERSRAITTFVAVSEVVRRQYLLGNPSYPAASVVTIPNAFDASQRPAVDRSQARAWLGLRDEFLFLSLGRHTLQKNPYGLVDAFADVAAAVPDAHLLVAGRVEDWYYAQQVRLLRDGSPARERIHLRDNSQHVPALLAAADAYVLDSFFEGWPISSMEALAAGLPVVLSDVSGAREQLGSDGFRGIVVPNPLGVDPERATWDTAGAARFQRQANRDELVAAMIAVAAARDTWAARRPAIAKDAHERFPAEVFGARYAEVLRRASSQT